MLWRAEPVGVVWPNERRVAHDLMDGPHIAGRRISVRQVYALVETQGSDPETVADRYDLDVADIYHALAYYHDHPREMGVENDREDAFEAFQESIDRPDGVDPEPVPQHGPDRRWQYSRSNGQRPVSSWC